MRDPTLQPHLLGPRFQGWMRYYHVCVYEEVAWCIGEGLEPRACSKAWRWCAHLRVSVDNCDAIVSLKP